MSDQSDGRLNHFCHRRSAHQTLVYIVVNVSLHQTGVLERLTGNASSLCPKIRNNKITVANPKPVASLLHIFIVVHLIQLAFHHLPTDAVLTQEHLLLPFV